MRLSTAIGRGWSIYAHLTGVIVLAGLFAYGLGKTSEGVGAILVVEGRAEAPELAAGRPLRVELGGKLTYGLHWHYTEGGCDSYVVATFQRPDGKESATVGYRRKGKPRAVGQPGFETIVRDLPPGLSAGLWHYRVVVEGECPTRRPPDVLFAEFDIEIVDPNAPIITVASFVCTTPVVRAGGKVAWRSTFRRRLTVASGTSVATYVADPPSSTPGTTDVYTQRRPIAYPAAGEYRDIDVVQDLPSEIRPGRWRLRVANLQTLADGAQQLDPVGEFVFEVVP